MSCSKHLRTSSLRCLNNVQYTICNVIYRMLEKSKKLIILSLFFVYSSTKVLLMKVLFTHIIGFHDPINILRICITTQSWIFYLNEAKILIKKLIFQDYGKCFYDDSLITKIEFNKMDCYAKIQRLYIRLYSHWSIMTNKIGQKQFFYLLIKKCKLSVNILFYWIMRVILDYYDSGLTSLRQNGFIIQKKWCYLNYARDEEIIYSIKMVVI